MTQRRRLLCIIAVSGLTLGIVLVFREAIVSYIAESDLPLPTLTSEPHAQDAAQRDVDVGNAAPDFTVIGEGGRPVSLSGFRGEWVVLVFSRGHW